MHVLPVMLILFSTQSFIEGLNITNVDHQNADILDLKRQLSNLQQRVDNIVKGQHGLHSVRPIAFTACLMKYIDLGALQTIEFDHVITNVGNAYDSRHGVFRAPISGLYHFSVTMYSLSGHPIHLQMVKDGTELIHVYSGGSDHLSSSTDVNVMLSTGEDVWCRHFEDPSSVTTNGAMYPCFSGHLITET